jgi:hypothetical protein
MYPMARAITTEHYVFDNLINNSLIHGPNARQRSLIKMQHAPDLNMHWENYGKNKQTAT